MPPAIERTGQVKNAPPDARNIAGYVRPRGLSMQVVQPIGSVSHPEYLVARLSNSSEGHFGHIIG